MEKETNKKEENTEEQRYIEQASIIETKPIVVDNKAAKEEEKTMTVEGALVEALNKLDKIDTKISKML